MLCARYNKYKVVQSMDSAAEVLMAATVGMQTVKNPMCLHINANE
jgi:hypothetical protein